jgi:hypothetical protein
MKIEGDYQKWIEENKDKFFAMSSHELVDLVPNSQD